MHSMRFIAVLDDCNDSKEAGNDQMQEEGEREDSKEKIERKGERIQRRREGERKKGKKEGRERGKEKRGRKGGGKEGRRKGRRKSALGERGARSTCTLYERNPRRRRWAVVHLCTPTLEYPEYHARLRSNILNTKHAYDRLS